MLTEDSRGYFLSKSGGRPEVLLDDRGEDLVGDGVRGSTGYIFMELNVYLVFFVRALRFEWMVSVIGVTRETDEDKDDGGRGFGECRYYL